MNPTKHHHILLLAAFLLSLLVSSCSSRESSAAPHSIPDTERNAEFNLVRDCIAQTRFCYFPRILNVVPAGEPEEHHLEDFKDVLNDETCDFYEELKSDAYFGYRSECEKIRLAGVDAPMLFVQARNGSFGGTSIYILRRDQNSGKWRNLHGKLEEGNISDIFVLPVTVNGITRFLEPDMDYGPKLLRGFRVLDYDPDTDEFVVVASAKVRHSFELSPEDAKWIGREALEKMAFDDHEEDLGEQFFKWGDRTLHHRRFLSSSFHSSNGYYLHIEESGQTVWPREETGWDGQTKFVTGFLPVSRDGTNALVLVEQERSNNVLDAYRLSVLDIDSLQIIHTHVLFDQQILTMDDGFAGEPYSGVPLSPRYLGLAFHGSLYIGETKEDAAFNAAERERDHETPLYRNTLFLRQTSQGGVEEWRVLLTTGSEWRLGDGSGDWEKARHADLEMCLKVMDAKRSSVGRYLWLVCDPHTYTYFLVCSYDLRDGILRILGDGDSIVEGPDGTVCIKNRKTYLCDENGNSLGAAWYDECRTLDGTVVKKSAYRQ